MEKTTQKIDKVIVLENKCIYMTSFFVMSEKSPLIGETYNVGPGKTAIPQKLYDYMIKKDFVNDKIKNGMYKFVTYDAKCEPCVKGSTSDTSKAAELSKLDEDLLYEIINPKSEDDGVFDVFVLQELVNFEKRANVSTWAKQKLELINK
jgi:hypothetical protein